MLGTRYAEAFKSGSKGGPAETTGESQYGAVAPALRCIWHQISPS